MEWRFRSLISVFADLGSEYLLKGNKIQFFFEGENPSSSAKEYLMDISLRTDTIEDAYYKGYDFLNEALDRIAYLSNASTSSRILSVTIPEVKLGEEFEIGVPYGLARRTVVPDISSESFEALDSVDPESIVAVALNSYRSGLSSKNPYTSFEGYWKAIESLAEKEAKDKSEIVEKKCPKCGNIYHRHPASQKIIMEKLSKLGGKFMSMKDKDRSEYAKELRGHRGRVVHGQVSDNSFREKIEESNAVLQPTAGLMLSEVLGQKLLCDKVSHIGTPFWSSRIAISSLNPLRITNAENGKYEVKASFPSIPPAYAEHGSFGFIFGIGGEVPLANLDKRFLPKVLDENDSREKQK